MSIEVYTFDVTTPAGTAADAPQTVQIPMPDRQVDRIDVVAPAGLNGTVGFQIGMAGQQIIPVNTGGWIVTSAETVSFDLTGLPTSGAWEVFTYNTGIYPHTLHIRFVVSLPGGDSTTAPTLATMQAVAALSSADLAAVPVPAATP